MKQSVNKNSDELTFCNLCVLSMNIMLVNVNDLFLFGL